MLARLLDQEEGGDVLERCTPRQLSPLIASRLGIIIPGEVAGQGGGARPAAVVRAALAQLGLDASAFVGCDGALREATLLVARTLVSTPETPRPTDKHAPPN
eukprot:COSAG01_NODE_963_length_12407_cov_38.330598_9_plen_102_part_00